MSIKFGTSGLRGPATGFTPETVTAYVAGFLKAAGEKGRGPDRVYVGADLRASSPDIARLALRAIAEAGWEAVYAGNVPTPALANYALAQNCPAVMITGSHIPEDYNGIKFYRRDGEMLKDDEAPVREAAERTMGQGLLSSDVGPLPEPDGAIAQAYAARYRNAFAAEALAGQKIGVDLHSAVGRDLLVEILAALGAKCFPIRRSERFIAVDTEAVASEDIARAQRQIAEHGLDAVVSTDGDGDRPLLIGADGRQVNGDVLGLLTARALGIRTLVTPLSSTSAIEQAGWFETVIRTRIGSPYVVAAMTEAGAGAAPVAGFEANGGFLLGSDIAGAAGKLSALPTRDAVLPLVAVLAAARLRPGGLAALRAGVPERVMKADRLKEVPAEESSDFLERIARSAEGRAALHSALAGTTDVNVQDGVRLTLGDGRIVHFRQSGNAPELRCYVETGSAPGTDELLAEMMAAMARTFGR